MSMHFSRIAEQAAADGAITADEILALRREGWGDGRMTHEEAEAIFALDAALAEKPAEWCDFLVEAVGEYVLNAWEPRDYVTEDQSDWLIARVAADGRLDSMTELELLLRVMEKATNTPDALKAFVLGELERAVLTGEGPTRKGGVQRAGVVDAADCAALRRAIFAAGGDRPAAVSREEAEMLFRLKNATLGGANAPEWQQLFVQGVGNYLQGYSALHAQLSPERAAELEGFMNDNASHVGRFLGRMAGGVPHGFRKVFGVSDEVPSAEEQAADAALLKPSEQAWLDHEIGKDGKTDPLEAALLEFLATA